MKFKSYMFFNKIFSVSLWLHHIILFRFELQHSLIDAFLTRQIQIDLYFFKYNWLTRAKQQLSVHLNIRREEKCVGSSHSYSSTGWSAASQSQRINKSIFGVHSVCFIRTAVIFLILQTINFPQNSILAALIAAIKFCPHSNLYQGFILYCVYHKKRMKPFCSCIWQSLTIN